MEVELEVIGRHAMFFDDDATAAFVNTKEALIEWNSLFIDRFDVRNLLSNPPSSFRKVSSHGVSSPDADLQSQLDLERYADLPSPSFQSDVETEAASTVSTGYHSVAFSYGNSGDLSDQKNADVGSDTSAFSPPFPVPESLLQNLPPTEKVHQIIARTALFVSEHGGQSEIILRVKQGDNPTFGFLMPHHHLHPYFRYLVDHPQLLKADLGSKSKEVKTTGNQTGGALSLLGSIYGTVEDEDGAPDVNRETKQAESDEGSAEAVLSDKKITGPVSVAGKDEIISKVPQISKVKALAFSKNQNSSIKPPNPSTLKKDPDILASNGPIMDKPKASGLFPVSDAEMLPMEPPSELKRLIDRIVEIILKNGKDFEAVLIEQNSKHGRFPFLLPSNQYHSYYLKLLKKAQESRVSFKSFNTDMDQKSAPEKDSDVSSLGTSSQDLSFDHDKKEKFKMVINKSKKDPQDHPSKDTQKQTGITVDTAAAAAILQAATRGIKKPNLDLFSKTTLSGASHGSSNEGGQGSSMGSLQSLVEKELDGKKLSVTIPVAKEIAKTAARSAASEADSSEAGLTREQKLKAERLRRAKMFAAMIKSGAVPLGSEPQQTSQAELAECKVHGSVTVVGDGVLKDREGSSGHAEVGTSSRVEPPMRNTSDDDIERKAKLRRHYRSRKRDDDDDDDDDDDSEEDEYGKREEDEDDESGDVRHSRKKRRSRRSSRHHRDRSKDVHKRRKKHSSRSKESRHRHKHGSSSSLEEDDRRSRYKHVSSSDDEDKDEYHNHKHKHKHKHKHDDSSDDERKHRKRKRRHDREDEKYRRRSKKGEKSRNEADLEEGEIITKSSDHSSSAIGDDTSTEASVDALKSSCQEKAPSLSLSETSEVPDELRAKIRAMLLATM